MGWKFYNSTGQLLSAVGSAASADLATVATTVTVTDNENTNENNVLTFVANADSDGGNVGLESDGNLYYNPSTGTLAATILSGTVATATVGTTVTVTDNESTNENNLVTFVADAGDSTGAHGIEMDGTFHYNPSTGLVTATGFAGALTGSASGTAATVTGGTQASITTVANVVTVGALNAGSITSGFGTIDIGSSALGSGAITSTGVVTGTGFTIGSAVIGEAELEILDGATVTTAELNLIDGNTGRGTTAVASGDGILINDAGTMAMTNVDTVSTYFAAHSVGGSNIATVGTIGTGTWQGTVIAEAYLPNAGAAVEGVVELATVAETDSGTDAARTVTPDSLAGSVFGQKTVVLKIISEVTVLTTDHTGLFTVPLVLNGMDLVHAEAAVYGVSSSGLPTIQIHNLTDGSDMLSTEITIDTSEFSSYTAATRSVVNTGEDDVVTGDRLRIDVDVAGSGTDGLDVILTFEKVA